MISLKPNQSNKSFQSLFQPTCFFVHLVSDLATSGQYNPNWTLVAIRLHREYKMVGAQLLN